MRVICRRTPRQSAERFLREHARIRKKASSVRMDELNLKKHVIPRLGSRKVAEVTHVDVERFHQNVGVKTARGGEPRIVSA